MHPIFNSPFLPEQLRPRSSQVRVFHPKVILLDFHGTISERKWEEKVIFPYIKRALAEYMQENWDNQEVQNCIPALRYESFEQRFRNKCDDAPVIMDQTDENTFNSKELANQLSDFLLWQISTHRETRECQIIGQLVWKDGIRKRHILTPIYTDVMAAVKRWHEQYHCSIYLISSIESDSLRLLMENTDKGNLHRWLSGYVSATKAGDKKLGKFYFDFFSSLKPMKQDKPISDNGKKFTPEQKLASKEKMVHMVSAESNKASTSDILDDDLKPRPALFLTDSGQEAKAAYLSTGHNFDCVLINRPGNVYIRAHYLCMFPTVNNFDDLELVPI